MKNATITSSTATRQLPNGWRWVQLKEVCEINPRRPTNLKRTDGASTTFVPMQAVDEERGVIAWPELRPFAELKRGYTYFAEGDVLFAKITPCMQNGKHAVARGLTNKIGFGSTEFHIIRPSTDITAEWIHSFLRRPSVLLEASAHFTGAVGQQRVPEDFLTSLEIPLPTLAEQKRIAAVLNQHTTVVEQMWASAKERLEAARALPAAYVRQSFNAGENRHVSLRECLEEVTNGVGPHWPRFRVVGATRGGIAPAKERVGKCPERYKPVVPGTIFYNPMRILIGSIAMIDEGDEPGIASPDYVVVKTRNGVLNARWFYYWLRSRAGEDFIRSRARGAVRERMLYRRLAQGEIELPSWDVQCEAAQKMIPARQLEKSIQEDLDTLKVLPAALFRRAFGGGL